MRMVEEDWEMEFQKDSIYLLEWQKEMEASWQEAEYYKSTKIEIRYETKYKRRSFRKLSKKLSILRSHLSVKPRRATV